jgi:hypothetical protein
VIDTTTGLCLYCGAERRRDAVRCPVCERMWPDRAVTAISVDLAEYDREPAGSPVSAAPGLSNAPRRPGNRVLIPIAVAVGALVVYLAVFWLFVDRGGEGPGETAGTTLPAQQTTVPATEAPATTVTTATPATTTLLPTTTLAPIEPIGEAVPLEDLTLGAFAIGPVDFGSKGAEAVGRLVASLGQPDAIEPAGTAEGLCDGTPGELIAWGGLSVIVAGEGGDAVLAGYRLDITASGGDDQRLRTISGLGLGDSRDQLQDTYPTAVAIDGPDGAAFVVTASTDGKTLLWGTLAESGGAAVVSGIYSPRACDAGPTP